MAYDPTVWQPDESNRDLLFKAHITDRIESAINQITDAKNLRWTIDCISDIVDSEGPKIIFTEKARYPEHKPESMSIRLKSIWDEITEKNLWNDDDKVMDIYTERIITEVEAWLDYLAEKRKEQPSVKVDVSAVEDKPIKNLPGYSCAVKIDGPDDTPAVKKAMTKAEFYAFLKNKDVQKTLLHIADARHLNGYLEHGTDVFLQFSPPNSDDWEEPYRISLTEYYDRNHWTFEENPALVLADLKKYVEKKLDAFLFMDKDFHTENETKNAEEARELNRNLFALLIMTKGYHRLTKLADRRGMKVKYDGQERSVTFYKIGSKPSEAFVDSMHETLTLVKTVPMNMSITIKMDYFVDSMSSELLSADDDDKVAWFTEYCDSTIERHMAAKAFERDMHSLSYIHDSIRKWCEEHKINVTFIDKKEDPLKTGYMIFWVYPNDRVRQEALVIDIANNPEFAGLCHEERDYADNGLAPWHPRYHRILTSYALVIDDAQSIIQRVVEMVVTELLTPKKKPPLAKGLQEAFKNYSSKELYKSCNSVPKEWIDQFIEENAYFEDFMRASVNTIMELVKFIRMKEQEAEGGNDHGE